ncbi:unnamed protein product [Mytilus edulis]|uniref:Uncharacterized protein n=1 Tax=Mytilus edulis TaxID=6550 RepID=A0A8S3U5Z6_MYTED|nr:unnamed protein product [Mytilus edulis]
MASRRKRKSTSRFSPDSIEISRQESDCSSWTVKKFKEELTNIGINITSKLSKTVLQQIYFDNLKSVSEPEQLSNEDQEVSPILPNVTSNSSNELPLLIGNLTEVVIGLRDSMNSNTNRNNSNTSLSADFSGNIQDTRRNRFQQVHTADDHVFTLYKWYGVSPSESDCGINPTLNTSTATINGVPSSSVPFLDIISPALKKQIIEGRDVNLAGLLMKDYESVQAASTLLTSSGLEINLPGKRISGFIERSLLKNSYALLANISVMCRVFPQRSEELDCYLANILQIESSYGEKIYEYHKLFAAKAATALRDFKVKFDWGVKDNDILTLLAPHARPEVCRLCYAIDHGTNCLPSFFSISRT